MSARNPIRVLIVEDDTLVGQIIQMQVEEVGYVVAGRAMDGRQAVEQTLSLRPDVILMDVVMPEMDGLEATRQIQERCPTPVVLLTAHDAPEFVARAGEAGAGAYLIKAHDMRAELERAITITTARFADMMALRRMLKDKESLRQEIRRRVSATLLVIDSLLKLQANSIRDQVDAELFQSSQNRVRAVALIIEKLHETTDLARFDFGGYVLSLVRHLCGVYPASGIEPIVGLRERHLDIEQVIPCALITCELVSNALRHAFPPERGRQYHVYVDMYPDGERRTLVVRDDGVGFPADLDFRASRSLGLHVVMVLVNQLGGVIELDKNGGTTFKITF